MYSFKNKILRCTRFRQNRLHCRLNDVITKLKFKHGDNLCCVSIVILFLSVFFLCLFFSIIIKIDERVIMKLKLSRS